MVSFQDNLEATTDTECNAQTVTGTISLQQRNTDFKTTELAASRFPGQFRVLIKPYTVWYKIYMGYRYWKERGREEGREVLLDFWIQQCSDKMK